MKNIKEIIDIIACPKTKQSLILKNEKLFSLSDNQNSYNIINDIPILINKENSFFSKINIQKSSKKNLIKSFLISLLPNIVKNLKAKKNFMFLNKILKNRSKVLIIGGGHKGASSEIIINDKKNLVFVTDVVMTEEVDIVNDAHNLCFKDNVFDCVIIQAVLEHVLEPHVCVDEIYRVLKKNGFVYAETPFMQQVHMKSNDFTRFTHLGHLWLFKNFEEIDSGPCCGPGMTFAWSYVFLLRSFFNNSLMVKILTVFGYCTSFFFKYLDFFLINKKGAFDSASGIYFLGKKTDQPLSKKQLINKFIGN